MNLKHHSANIVFWHKVYCLLPLGHLFVCSNPTSFMAVFWRYFLRLCCVVFRKVRCCLQVILPEVRSLSVGSYPYFPSHKTRINQRDAFADFTVYLYMRKNTGWSFVLFWEENTRLCGGKKASSHRPIQQWPSTLTTFHAFIDAAIKQKSLNEIFALLWCYAAYWHLLS